MPDIILVGEIAPGRDNCVTMRNGGNAVFWPNSKRAKRFKRIEKQLSTQGWVDIDSPLAYESLEASMDYFIACEPQPAIFQTTERAKSHPTNSNYLLFFGSIRAEGFCGVNAVIVVYSVSKRVGIVTKQRRLKSDRGCRKLLNTLTFSSPAEVFQYFDRLAATNTYR